MCIPHPSSISSISQQAMQECNIGFKRVLLLCEASATSWKPVEAQVDE